MALMVLMTGSFQLILFRVVMLVGSIVQTSVFRWLITIPFPLYVVAIYPLFVDSNSLCLY